MPQQLITSAGITALSNAISRGTSVNVIGYRIGSRVNFTPASNITNVDTLVFPSTGVATNGLSYTITNGVTNQVLFRISLNSTLGNFNVGNIGLFIGSTNSPILLAIVTLDETDTKTATVINGAEGNILTYDMYITVNDIANSINYSLIDSNTNSLLSLPTVTDETNLPDVTNTNLKTIIVRSHSSYNNKPVIAQRDTTVNPNVWEIITSVLTDTTLNVTTPANESTLLGASRQAIAEAISNINVTVSNASTTVSGIVELATNTETQTGTDAVRAVTPAGLASLTATVSRRGLIELATQTEVDSGTDTSRAVTPATLNSYVDDEIGSNITDSDLNVSTPANESTTVSASRQAIAEALSDINQSIVTPSNASLTVKGIIELATDAEANTGTDSSRAVVPSSLKYVLDNRNASATKTGLIELATQTEVDTGTDTSRAVTPATLNSYVDDAIGSNITDSDLNVSTPANESTTIAPSRQVVAETINSNLNDASVSQKGFVELATNTETQTGTDAVRAVTPASLASLTATASRRGLIELATQTEVDSGSDTEKGLTSSTIQNLLTSFSYPRNSSIDYDTLSAAGNNDPRGIYSDGETIWVVDSTDVIVYAYESDSKNRKSSLDITNSVLTGAGNSHPYGITGNRYGILYVSDTNDNKVYSYKKNSSGNYVANTSYNLDSSNTNCADIHLDERLNRLYVTDTVDDKVYSYTTSGNEISGSLGDRVESLDINLALGNDDVGGIWSDGTYIWVSDHNGDHIYVYNLSTRNRETTKEFDLPSNSYPKGMWSDGTYIWIVGSTATTYAYNLSTGARETSQEFNSSYDSGIWGNNNYIWVANYSTYTLQVYDKNTKVRVPSKDIYVGSGMHGIWSDGTYIWVTIYDSTLIRAYNLSTGNRDTTKEFNSDTTYNDTPKGMGSDGTYMFLSQHDNYTNRLFVYVLNNNSFSISHSNTNNDFETLSAAGNNDPVSVTSDVNNLYVADGTDNKIYTYNINTKVRTPLLDVRNYAGSAMKGITLTDGNLLIADSSTDKIYGYSNFLQNLIYLILKDENLIS